MLHGAPNSRLVHYTAIIFMLCLATSGAARPIAAGTAFHDGQAYLLGTSMSALKFPCLVAKTSDTILRCHAHPGCMITL
jgi:hypothetical protein